MKNGLFMTLDAASGTVLRGFPRCFPRFFSLLPAHPLVAFSYSLSLSLCLSVSPCLVNAAALPDDTPISLVEALPDLDLPRLTERGDLVTDLRALRVKAKEQGGIPVIIGLRMKSKLDDALNGEQQALQRSRITALQEGVLGELYGELPNKLPNGQLQNIKRFRYTPHLAMTISPEVLERLLQSERVTSIEEDITVEPTLTQSVPLVNANKAWTAGYNGNGWAVAVLDTGVQSNHPFLAGRVVHEACFSTTNTGQGTQSLCPNGSNQQTGAGAAAPCTSGCTHGTHVAGIAAGAGSSFSGVAPGASVIAIQVFSRKLGCAGDGCVTSYSSDWMRALEHVYSLRSQYNIASVNMSLGGNRSYSYCDGYTDTRAAKQDIDNLRAVGIATVIASGNEGYVDSTAFPACISSAISVGSVWDAAGGQNSGDGWNGGQSSVDEVAAYSNSASILDLLAPGSAIYSSFPGGSYASSYGTSMAAPHVAGCWSLLKQAKPTATVDEVKQALISTGVPVQDWRNGLTKPRIDCKAALDRLTGTTVAANAADLQISVVSISPSSVTGSGQVSISASVRNAGTATSSATTLRYYRSADATITNADTALSCTSAIASLTPGAFASAPLCQTSAPATAGTYYYGVCVSGVAGESDTANNCSNGQVVTVSSGGQPDLIVTAVSGSAQASVGGNLSVTVTVKNHGTAAAVASEAKLYLSANTTITEYDTYLTVCNVTSLAAQASDSCSGSIPVPTSVTPGTYYIGVIADASGLVSESNEQNNTLATTGATTIANTIHVTSLGDAVDNTSLSWVTGGDANWYRQTAVSYNGGDAARSGAIGANQVSYLQTTVTGPGTFLFYWKVSSESDYDALALILDGELVDYISGETNWTPVSLSIPSGIHTVTWAYVKDDSISGGQDAGWVDKVVFSYGGASLSVAKAGPGAGTVTSLPTGINCGVDCNETYALGTNVTLTARPDHGYVFAGWSGACTGIGACSVAMNATQSVTAWFSRPSDGFPSTPLPSGWSLYPSDSNAPWAVTSDSAHGGLSSLKSGVIGNDRGSAVSYAGLFREGYVSFAAKISSEADYDYFMFIIDGELVDYGSGEIDWTEVSYPITAGAHTLTWAYAKDELLTEGKDAAWIDSVNLPLASSVGVLGTPVVGGTVSGVGVISGYHCSSKDIDVYIDGGHIGKAGAGTTLLGTLPICGHADTGYSLLYNFNNLANGQHTVAVYADGAILDSRTVTTFQSGGTPWLSGASKLTTVPDFPQAGQTATLQWVQSYQNFLISSIGSGTKGGVTAGVATADIATEAIEPFASALAVANVGVLGTPVAGTTVSGVGVISGYHCWSKDIDVYIDGAYIGKAGAGTTLLGTQGVCGRTDTGYSLLYNFNNLANGQHLVEVYAAGSFLDSHTVTTFQSGGAPWLSGASKTVKIADFPQAGKTATLQWVQSYQNFLITGIAKE